MVFPYYSNSGGTPELVGKVDYQLMWIQLA